MRSTLDTVAAIGLAIGGAFGLAGTFVANDALRETVWAIDGVALVVAAALLTMKYQRLGNDCVAAGFLTFVAGESLLLAGNAAGLQASVPSYLGGISLWAAALVLISAPRTFAPIAWLKLASGFSGEPKGKGRHSIYRARSCVAKRLRLLPMNVRKLPLFPVLATQRWHGKSTHKASLIFWCAFIVTTLYQRSM